MSYVEVSPALAKAIMLAKTVRNYEKRAFVPPAPIPPPPVLPSPAPYGLAVGLSPDWCVFPDLEQPAPPQRTSRVAAIIREACRWYGCPREGILNRRRDHTCVMRRYVVIYLAKMLTEESFPSIGRRLGGYDHTTILHGFRKADDLVTGRYLLDRLALYESGYPMECLTRLKFAERGGMRLGDFERDLERVRSVRRDVAAIRELVRVNAGF